MRHGINATVDDTNRRNATTPSVLIAAEDDDIYLTLNKVSTSDGAYIAFQKGYSSRAIIGLLGNNAFSIKVSPDGTNNTTSMILDPVTGNIGIGYPPTGDKLEIRAGVLASCY